MKDYLLFIDTEASGLPKEWRLPYTAECNWPYAVQVSWLIYSKEGEKIREQNYYINNNDFDICPTALSMHGLTKEFLKQHGIPRRQVLKMLSRDLLDYQPMVVGHFIELDYRVMGAEYYREAMENPMEKLSTFCIMKASQHLQQNPRNKYLRLGALFELLFKKPLPGQHNSIVDAAATADCFFELVRTKEIKSFIQSPIVFQQKTNSASPVGWMIALLIILLIASFIVYNYG